MSPEPIPEDQGSASSSTISSMEYACVLRASLPCFVGFCFSASVTIRLRNAFDPITHLSNADLRSCPDVVATWSDDEVARRGLTLFPRRRNKDGSAAEPSVSELAMITGDPEVLAQRRRRLNDVSWWISRYHVEALQEPHAGLDCGGCRFCTRRHPKRATAYQWLGA